jgi:uncharacterized protein YuzE
VHGDLPVMVFDPDKLESGDLEEVDACISLGADEDGKVKSITIVDRETQLSFDGIDGDPAEEAAT